MYFRKFELEVLQTEPARYFGTSRATSSRGIAITSMLRRPAAAAANSDSVPMTEDEQESLLAEVAQEAGAQRKNFQRM
jgi:hypothetical protein